MGVDRLGSVRYTYTINGATMNAYFPYGMEYNDSGASATDTEKYATYTRDKVSGLDYAVNRHYNSQWARFMSPDPYRGSMDLTNPGSLNRYTYAWNDSVNSNDPTGLCIIDGAEYPDPCFSVTGTAGMDGGPGGGSHPPPVPVASDPPCPPVPVHTAVGPNNAQIRLNVEEAMEINWELQGLVGAHSIDSGGADAMRLAWLLYEVFPGQPMDYKKYGSPGREQEQLRQFGNFNFGAVAAGLGYNLNSSLWGAGAASYLAIGVTNLFKYGILKGAPPSFGTPFTGPPYGDDPLEQGEIKQGYLWAESFMAGGCGPK